MSAAKHTDGPWTIHRDDSSTTVEIRDARGIFVAEVGDTSLEDEANARLIVASPALLAALRDVLRIAKAASIGVTGNLPRLARADAAIALALGSAA